MIINNIIKGTLPFCAKASFSLKTASKKKKKQLYPLKEGALNNDHANQENYAARLIDALL